MKTTQDILQSAQKTLLMESEALKRLSDNLCADFAPVVLEVLNASGRLIITGIGKSAIIAQKIVATLNSTGTPSIFMHAADAVHGDLGMIQENDVLLAISKSGNTPEIKVLVPLLKQSGNKLIGMVGNLDSYLAKHSDYVLDTTVLEEACPNNLAPTTSTTAQLAMGDALAVALLEAREFTASDFAKYHPGGALGKKLYLKVEDVIVHNDVPKVLPSATMKEVILEISSKRLGATAVVKNNELMGVITDGDLRRMMEKQVDFSSITAEMIMNTQPRTISKDAMAIEALEMIKQNNVSQLIVLDDRKYVGLLHFHDLMKEGII